MGNRWERTLSTGKVANALGLSNATVQGYAREGRIPANTTPGGQYRFNLDEVRATLAGDILHTADLPSFDDGPAVLVSTAPQATGDERSDAWRRLRAVVPSAPVEGAKPLPEGEPSDLTLEGMVQRSPAAVTSYLQLQ